ncbi:MAG: Inner membrane component of TAM transport system [uncultured Sphingosinicella sp.]|uniref:Inner membrane component of TAM transport system n=1 Tax=uncultured Sphingosinicella sp. TaxID=478748 RepID=A0A6J4TDZ3_9SPHN|nr:translocation/assembly module TamB domain-containing protein [uncultured Sphingosinicella sp.]CAA9520299.1 MAG: Inner membrane component of TAM transport system [uncultured Sphingosinicella sp.]
MNDETPGRFEGEQEEVLVEPRSGWMSRNAKLLLGLLLVLLLGIAALTSFLDTQAGHRFIADRIAAQAPKSGLRIQIGAIEGSIWGETRLRDVRLSDPQGLFAEAQRIDLNWQPLGWLSNRLLIDSLQSDLVILHRLPKLRLSEEPQPILPGFDIRIGRLRVAELRLGRAITGQPRSASLIGQVDVRSGRALIDLKAQVRGGGDRLAFLIDAEPDRDRFDVDVRLQSPEGGVAGALAGTRRPILLQVQGDGRWSRWAGTARLDLSGRRTAELALRAEEGRYSVTGAVAPAQFWTGKKARLAAPRVLLNARATLADRRLDGSLSLRSAALKLESRGTIDLARSRFDGVKIGADLLQPSALFPNMTARSMRLTALLNGAFRRADFAYRITTPQVAFDRTGFEDVKAEGRGQWSREPVSVPVVLTARRVTGVGDVAGGILGNLKVSGVLKVTQRELKGEGFAVTSDKLKGKASLFVDLVTGRYDVVLSGGLTRYLIPGLGVVDVLTELKVVPNPGGRGTLVTGRGRAWVRRLDNRFLLGLAGGLPQLETDLVRTNDGVLRFSKLRLVAPAIRIEGLGMRRRDGTFFFEGSGRQAQYGPFVMTLDGRIERPKLAIRLARPNEAMGLTNVLLLLDPTPQGFAYRAEGGSTLGPFTSRGAILLPAGQPATIQVAALNVSGTAASGMLRSDPGGFTGRLNVAGGGVGGALLFNPVGNVQRIEAHLTAEDARFLGPPPIAIRRGKLDGVILLNPGATSVEGTLSARGLTRGPVSLARLDAQASLRGGVGQVRANFAGNRGRDFAFNTVAEVAPGRIRLTGSGTVDRRPIQLSEPALLTSAEGGWRLAPTALSFAGGSATVSGLFGAARTEFDASMRSMPLTVVDIAYPRLGLGGIASGTLSYREQAGGQPTGAANLRVRGLTRSGLVLSSRPVDLGLVAKMAGGNAAMRAIAVSEGRTIGRAQARLAPISGGGSLADRLYRAPLFAQLRYNGPADTLWRLTGIELLDLSGPVAVGADARGTLNDPQIRGSLRTERARLESPVLGTIVENIAASGRFGGSRLVVESFSGATKGGGRVSGRGAFDFSAQRGFGIDLAVNAQGAQLIDRDDIKAQVSGPLRFRSDGSGGTISGDLALDSGSFRLGSATAAAKVPRLSVRETGRADDDLPRPAARNPWTMDIALRADDRLAVTGLGITSEWGADLKLGGNVTEPRINGRADLVRGSYDFAGRRFDLERGTIRFLGESPPNPILDITAEGGIRGLNATIRVTGRGQRPEIAFTSTPALPQDELLSRLLFGTSITNLSAPEALQLAAAVAALNNSGGGLDPINSVRSAVGLDRLRILPADIATGQGTSIAAGKYLGRQVYVEVITDGRGYSATRIEYQITRWLSLLSSISTIGRQSVNVRVSKDY